MWTWIISPMGRKIALWAAIVIALFVGVRWYGNQQWAKGEAQGRQFVADQLIKEKKNEWAEREREITAKEAQADQRLEDLTQAAQAVHAARAVLMKNFDVTLKEMEADRVESYRYAGAVPDADLIAELRAISGTLAGYADPAGTPSDTWPTP